MDNQSQKETRINVLVEEAASRFVADYQIKSANGVVEIAPLAKFALRTYAEIHSGIPTISANVAIDVGEISSYFRTRDPSEVEKYAKLLNAIDKLCSSSDFLATDLLKKVNEKISNPITFIVPQTTPLVNP